MVENNNLNNFFNCFNSININDTTTQDNSDSINNIEKKNEISLIGKKRNLFNKVNPNLFLIFNKGGNDNYIKQLIKESLKTKKSKKSINKTDRKYYSDNIRKKIKVKFLKSLKNRVNEQLYLAGSKKYFDYFQQEFVSNINKNINKSVLNLTFREIYSKNFSRPENYGHKYNNNNISVIEYLEKEKEISKNSKYDIFKDIKYYQIYEEYLRSKEFESDIYHLIRQKENYDYIKKYIQFAFKLNKFFYN